MRALKTELAQKGDGAIFPYARAANTLPDEKNISRDALKRFAGHFIEE